MGQGWICPIYLLQGGRRPSASLLLMIPPRLRANRHTYTPIRRHTNNQTDRQTELHTQTQLSPVPVRAAPSTSRPVNKAGMVRAWTSVRWAKPISVMACRHSRWGAGQCQMKLNRTCRRQTGQGQGRNSFDAVDLAIAANSAVKHHEWKESSSL